MLTENHLVYVAFALYLLVVLWIGWMAAERTHNTADYFLGSRQLGRWVAALSAGASDMSGWLLLGLPGFAYAAGLQAGWLALGLFAGTWINWKWIAPALRQQSGKAGDAITLPDFFAHCFPDHARLMRCISALFILLFYLFYTGSGLVAAGKLFESVFGFDYLWATCLGTLVILVYTVIGGFLAVSWTDLFQGLLMFFALTISAFMAVSILGGPLGAIDKLESANPAYLDWFSALSGEPVTWISILSLLGWGLGYFGQPHILARFMAIRSCRMIPGARAIAVTWSGCCLLAAMAVGMAGVLLVDQPLVGSDSERVFLEILPLLFHPFMAGLCLAAILAAIMSTADSQLLVASSAISEDLYHVLTRKQLSERRQLLLGRISVGIISLLALGLAMDPGKRVLDLVAYAWAGFGASFGPALLLTLFWKPVRGMAVLAGIITGGATVVLWQYTGDRLVSGVNEIIPGFILASLVIILISRSYNSHQ
jgi:sodium/proline symporter